MALSVPAIFVTFADFTTALPAVECPDVAVAIRFGIGTTVEFGFQLVIRGRIVDEKVGSVFMGDDEFL